MSITTFSPLSLSVTAGKRASKSRVSPKLIGAGKLPKLITMANLVASVDVPGVTAVTVQAHKSWIHAPAVPCASANEPEPGVYKTFPSATRFAIIVPLSASKAPYKPFVERSPDLATDPSSPHPRRSVTVQRLGEQTPSHPDTICYMSTRGGGRFSLMSRPELHRPASERLAARYVECEGDMVANDDLELTHQGLCVKQPLGVDPAPEKLVAIKSLVAKRLHPHDLELMDPLKLAMHNNLAHMATTSSRPRKQDASVTKTSKPNSAQPMRRAKVNLKPLDTEVARAYIPTDPATDSPLESPSPVTPTDEATSRRRRTLKDKGIAPGGSSKRGSARQVNLKGRSKVRMGHRF
ncbi:hypothetical protein FRC09_010051 [Ceratobasidium sp. 395]|nr:hypothetical protein FRC09_010051 [Ceratobasidium sp. 395]